MGPPCVLKQCYQRWKEKHPHTLYAPTHMGTYRWSKRREALEVDLLRYKTAVRLARGELRKVSVSTASVCVGGCCIG